jgi:carboxypeptidase T
MRRALARAILMVFFATLGGVVPSGGLHAQPELPRGAQVVRISVSSPEEVQLLAAALDVWDVEREAGYLIALVTPEEREWLEAQGYDVAVDETLTASLSAVAGLPCYRTMGELYADLERLAAERPDIVQVYSIGFSYEGRPLVVARLTNRAIPGDKPILFVMGGIHGRELITVEVVMAFAEDLAARYGLDPEVTWILDHHEVHLLISANPDGHAKNETTASYWRKNTHPYGVCTYYGVDLNRNHTFKWNACSGCSSGDPCAWCYRGPSAGSEPETRAVEAYVRTLFADNRGPNDGDPASLTTSGAFLTLHAYGNEVMWPWGWTSTPSPNADGLAALARKLARYNGYDAIPSWQLYYTDGTSDDWAYGTLGVAALTFEIGSSADGMYPPCSRYDALVQPNLDALFYAARAARAPYLQSYGPDAVATSPEPATVQAGAPVTLTALINDSATGGQAIAVAEYAVDVPWWDGGETTALNPVDGALDAPAEEVAAAIETDGWSPGRHTIWVHGRDAGGNWGPPSAAWVTVEADAAVVGQVTDSGSGDPLSGVRVRLDSEVAAEAWGGGTGLQP